MGKNIAIIILSLVLVLSLAGNVMLGAMLWVSVQLNAVNFGGAFAGLPGLTITETYPAQVNDGDSFTITIDIANTTTAPIDIHEIDFVAPLTDGIRVDSVNPQPTQINNYAAGAGYIEYMFSQSIPGGQSQSFVFQCTAIKPGTWSGTIDVYDPNFSMESRFVTINVQ